MWNKHPAALALPLQWKLFVSVSFSLPFCILLVMTLIVLICCPASLLSCRGKVIQLIADTYYSTVQSDTSTIRNIKYAVMISSVNNWNNWDYHTIRPGHRDKYILSKQWQINRANRVTCTNGVVMSRFVIVVKREKVIIDLLEISDQPIQVF